MPNNEEKPVENRGYQPRIIHEGYQPKKTSTPPTPPTVKPETPKKK